MAGAIGGRPGRFGKVQCRAISRRCHRRSVVGVTSRWAFNARGRSLVRAASTARSAQSNRGFGLLRRNTAFSCRNTKNSISLAAYCARR